MMRFGRCRFQVACIALMVVLLCRLFLRLHKDTSVKAKLKANKEIFRSGTRETLQSKFLSPLRNGQHGRQRSEGATEVRSNLVGKVIVRPPVSLQQDGRKSVKPSKVDKRESSALNNKKADQNRLKRRRKIRWRDNRYRRKRIRRVRSVSSKENFVNRRPESLTRSMDIWNQVSDEALPSLEEPSVYSQPVFNSDAQNGDATKIQSSWNSKSAHYSVTVGQPSGLGIRETTPVPKHFRKHIYQKSGDKPGEKHQTHRHFNVHTDKKLGEETPENFTYTEQTVHQDLTEQDASVHGRQKLIDSHASSSHTENGYAVRRLLSANYADDHGHIWGAEKPIPQSLPARIRTTLVNEMLWGEHFSENRIQGEKVELSCQNSALAALKQEKPRLRVQWLLNRKALPVGDDVLVIQSLTKEDNGVYECRVDLRSEALTVAVFALTVTADVPTLLPRETEPLYMDCHSIGLARVLRVLDLSVATDSSLGCQPPCSASNLSHGTTRQWFFNHNRTTFLPQDIPGYLAQQEKIERSRREMSGVWWCQVSHRPTNKQWNTSWYRVYVRDPPSAIECWWRTLLRVPLLAALMGCLALGACIGLAIMLARHTQKRDENLEVNWQITKARLKSRKESDLCPSVSVTSIVESDIQDILAKRLSRSPSFRGGEGSTTLAPAITITRSSSRTTVRSHASKETSNIV